MWLPLTQVEGLPLLGGAGRYRVPLRTGTGLLMEIEYPQGVSSPEHQHDHDSFIYLLSGHVRGTIAGQPCELHAGGTLLHPRGVLHSVEAVVTSRWLEFKSPPNLPVA
ncbi:MULTISPECIES: cupin domain-containing protein [unclassified Crossiella]|uniref:cupin domain-containing protein n=1 Tax=unclassified Crossiella TaxID=2620835 RepID=UPI001FFED884|nr:MULTISPECIES: cupin domain-containing protein [unclassified Crossiella]MCK2237443.1 cupin domain-containing protein [Crossiella sp. S99.2]MCK2251098.1 cupin domain-containing protein [Crossiella sp. S99.1]